MQTKGENPKIKKIFFAEIDMGTVSSAKIESKVIAYNLYFKAEREFFAEYRNTMRVLFVCNTAKRAEWVLKAIEDIQGSEFVWATSFDQVNPGSILSLSIWVDINRNYQSILKPQTTSKPKTINTGEENVKN